MGRNKSQERLKLEAIMDDDDRWWDRDELFEKWFPSVSPSVAMRAAEKSYNGTDSKERTKDVSKNQLQRIGAKHIFNQILGAMRSYNKVEERRRSGTVELRLVPEEVSSRFERYFSVAIVGDDDEFSIYDPHRKVLVLSMKECRKMETDDLKALMRWSSLHQDDHNVFTIAALMARKALNERNVGKLVAGGQ